jgi:hypothetical protein
MSSWPLLYRGPFLLESWPRVGSRPDQNTSTRARCRAADASPASRVTSGASSASASAR